MVELISFEYNRTYIGGRIFFVMGVREECGVVACVLKKESLNIAALLSSMLSELQHRGQTSSGIATFSKENKNPLKTLKESGKVSHLFRTWDKYYARAKMEEFNGEVGIGHVRYATSDVSDDAFTIVDEAQPFLRRHGRPWKRFAIAFNGHVANYEELKKELISEGYILDTNVDTEVIMHLVSLSLKKHLTHTPEGLFKSFEDVIAKLDGSFNCVFLNASGDFVVFRDSLGIRPLVIGENENLFAVASESKALTKIGITKFRDVKPGEIIILKNGELISKDLKTDSRRAHCHFEYVYFSDTCSVNDSILVNDVRKKLGKSLGQEEPLKSRFGEQGWIVIPVPSTSIPAAVAYSYETNVPFSFSLIKNDVGRGFINSKDMRKSIMDAKYSIIPGSVVGKKIILIDDSIIRGETCQRVIKLLRDAGASEVHLRVSEMPIKFPCFYGVDFPSFEELIAGDLTGSKKEIESQIAEKIGAESMGFVSFEGLKKSLGGNGNQFCFACLTGNYPTRKGQELANELKG